MNPFSSIKKIPIGVLLSAITVAILFSFIFLWIYVYIINGPIPPATLEGIYTCGNYRLLIYGYTNGDGYYHLVDSKDKVLDKLSVHEPMYIGNVNWEEDCRSLFIGGDEGITKMSANK